MKITALSLQELASNRPWTHRAVLTPSDITMATANTEQVFTLFTTQRGDQILGFGFNLDVPFSNSADAAYNTTTIRIGDQDDDDIYLVATELNLNGTEVYQGYNSGDFTQATGTYDAAKAIWVTLGAQTGKSLTSLNLGRVIILMALFRPTDLMLKPTGTS